MIAQGTVIYIGVLAVMLHALLVATEIALASCDRGMLRQRAAAGGLAARLLGREPAARPHAEEVMGVVVEPREAVSPVSDPNSPL